MNLIILGPQGSGKGTQAKLLAEKYGLTHISTGDLLRQEIASGSDFGQSLKETLDRGELVSDEVLFSILEKAPLNTGNGFILDGTPRNLYQAENLEKILQKINLHVDKVILLDLPYEESIQRMLKRAEIEHRADDNLETIKTRLAIYDQDTKPVIDFYRQQGKVLEIDGRPDIDTIFKDICNKLDSGVK